MKLSADNIYIIELKGLCELQRQKVFDNRSFSSVQT